MTATAFRKSLFTTLDSALQGQPVTVEYKGRKLRIVPEQPGTKLSRATPQGGFDGNEDQLEEAVRKASAERMTEWEAKWTDDARKLREELDADSLP